MNQYPYWLLESLLLRCLDALRQHDSSYHYLTPPALLRDLELVAEDTARREDGEYAST